MLWIVQKYLQYNPDDSVWAVKQAALAGLEVVRLFTLVHSFLWFINSSYLMS